MNGPDNGSSNGPGEAGDGRFGEDHLREVFGRVPTPPAVDGWHERVAPGRTHPRLALVAAAAVLVVLGGAVTATATLSHSPPRPAASPETTTPKPSAATTGQPSQTTAAAPSGSRSPDPSATGRGAGPPSGATTGVPAGVKLSTHTGDLHVTAAGTTVSGLLITGTLFVEAPNVTVRNTRMVPATDAYFAVRQLAGATNLQIEDSELAGDGRHRVEYGLRQEAAGLTLLRVDIHHADTGLVVGRDARVTDSFVHDLTGANPKGIFSTGGTPNLTIQHNTVVNPTGAGSCLVLYTDDGPQTNVLITGNLFTGGSPTVVVDSGGGSHDVRVTGNRFGPSTRTSGSPVRAWNGSAPGSQWTANVWDDTGKPVTP